MKKILLLLIITTLFSCNKEDTGDCFQTAGSSTTYEMEFPVFTKITVQKNIRLILKYGETQKVRIKTGENLKPEIYGTIDGDQLIFTNENDCNFVRDYDDTVLQLPLLILLKYEIRHNIPSPL